MERIDSPLLEYIKLKLKEFVLEDDQIIITKKELNHLIEESKLEVRDPHFDFPPYLVFDYTKNKQVTRLLNSLSLLFPVGERYFIEAVRKHEHIVNDEQLKHDIKIFYKQEGRHAREHRKLNNVLEAYGVDVKQLETEALERLKKYGGENIDDQLLITVSLENLTELLGIILPRIEKFIFNDNEYCKLYSYHAIEEQEHAHVARDIMNKYRNVSKLKQIKFMYHAVTELVSQTRRNYKALEQAERKAYTV